MDSNSKKQAKQEYLPNKWTALTEAKCSGDCRGKSWMLAYFVACFTEAPLRWFVASASSGTAIIVVLNSLVKWLISGEAPVDIVEAANLCS